jgi:hypothetical protein
MQNTDSVGEDDFSKFDTSEHRAAQRACACLIHHAIDAATRRKVWGNLQNARASADPVALETTLAQLTGDCPHRPVAA